MPNNRLRNINGIQTPQSSLGTTLRSVRRNDPFHPVEQRAAKRQKVEGIQQDTGRDHSSRYQKQTQNTKRPREEIQDDHNSSIPVASKRRPVVESKRTRSPEIHDLTICNEGSQPDDNMETVSLGSTAKSSNLAKTGVNEYRTAQPGRVVVSRRPRLSRKSQTPVQDQISSRQLSPSHVSVAATSPDILCQEEQDPPPAKVISDILSQTLARPPASKRVHRPPNGEQSDFADELAGSSPAGAKKYTNFSSLPASKRSQRGDIQRSFPAKAKAKARTQLFEASIAKAASGRFLYPQPGQEECGVKLLLKDDIAEVQCAGPNDSPSLPWLQVERSKIQLVEQSATDSLIVILKRSITNESPSPLALEFKAMDDAVRFVSWVPGGNITRNIPSDELDKKFRNLFITAEEYLTSHPKKISTSSNLSQSLLELHATTTTPKFPSRAEPNPPREKLKDRMQGSTPGVPPTAQAANGQASGDVLSMTRPRRLEPRRTRRLSPEVPFESQFTSRWTQLNPNWDKDWRMTLEFPANGKKRESVDKDDVARLDEGEFLNDNLINFYIRYLQAELEAKHPETLQKVHFFNTFLFPTIKSGGQTINYKGVEKWTAKIDLFSYKYIVVPINESLHWYLAIIYNAPKLLPKAATASDPETIDVDRRSEPNSAASPVRGDPETIVLDNESTTEAKSQVSSDTTDFLSQITPGKSSGKSNKTGLAGGSQRVNPNEPRIITLDSLGNAHSNTCKTLKSYLAAEAKHKKNAELPFLPLGLTAKHIPAQDNHSDCGAFVLGYMEKFLEDPDEAVRRLLQKEDVGWHIDASQIRTKVRNLILTLQKDFQAGEELKREERKRQRRLAKAAGFTVLSSPRGPPVPSSEAPTPKRDVVSPVTNGITSPAVAALAQVFSTPTETKPATSPEKGVQPSSPSLNRDAKFVNPLEDDSSLDSKTPTSGEAFHSARTSPEGASQIPVDLTTEKPVHVTQDSFQKRVEPDFVKQLSSSPTEVASESRGIKRSREETPEEVELVKVHANESRPRSNIHEILNSPQEILPSIEADKPITSNPQYDGVAQSPYFIS